MHFGELVRVAWVGGAGGLYLLCLAWSAVSPGVLSKRVLPIPSPLDASKSRTGRTVQKKKPPSQYVGKDKEEKQYVGKEKKEEKQYVGMERRRRRSST